MSEPKRGDVLRVQVSNGESLPEGTAYIQLSDALVGKWVEIIAHDQHPYPVPGS